ncbi:MAG: mechanosensitive ion channel family protein [Nitrospinota bacterium]|nr:mechanosensitive ion channel family protein [Nitrospinota bacterium]
MEQFDLSFPTDTLLAYKIVGIEVKLLALSFIILFITFIARRFIVNKTMSVLTKIAEKTPTKWDDDLVVISKGPLSASIMVVGVWIALSILPLPTAPINIEIFVQRTANLALILIFTLFFFKATDIISQLLKEKASDPKHWMDTSLVPLIILTIKVFVGVVIVVFIFQNLGYSVSALVASLGIGGIAVALAAQGTLANFFGSLMIMIDRPFRIGDWIQAEGGTYEGIVEEIGFRSTKLRTFEKTVQVIPNDKLAAMVLENMDRRKDRSLNIRRIKMTIGVEYKTAPEQIEKAVLAIRNILKESPRVDDRQIYVYFSGFGDSSLNIFIYFFANSTIWRQWLETRQTICFDIMKVFKELGIVMAFPTRTIYLEKSDDFPDIINE